MKFLLSRVLCLLLVISMITPVAASAATPLYSYPSVSFTISNGETTNEMAYVDQFFDGFGGNLNEQGMLLTKWLDIHVRDDADRVNSGYLMLEQEMEHQTGFGYVLSDVYIETTRKAMETVGSKGQNIAEYLVQEANFREKFPKAGGSAYIYYNYLYQMYFDYLNSLNSSIGEVDETLSAVCEAISDVTDIVSNNQSMKYTKYTIQDSAAHTVAMVPENFTGKVNTIDVIDIQPITIIDFDDVEHIGAIRYLIKTKDGTDRLTLQQLIDKMPAGEAFVFNLDAVDKLKGVDKVNELMQTDVIRSYQGRVHGEWDPGDAVFASLEGCLASVKASKAFQKLPNNVKKAFEKADSMVKRIRGTTGTVKVPDILVNTAEVAGNVADIVSAAADIYNYDQQRDKVETRQLCYLNALDGVSQEYVDTLTAWRASLAKSTLPNSAKESIFDALQALVLDILFVRNNTKESIEKEAADAAGDFTAASLTQAILSVADAGLGISGTDGIIEEMVKQAKGGKVAGKVSTASSICSLGSAMLNAATSRFVEFGDSSEAIYYMKWSLYQMLTESGGLLDQYGKMRNHETACKIIYALNSMKSAKIMGENLIDEYYLYKFYNDFNINVNGDAHQVLWSEMIGNTDWNIDDSVTNIVAVYEDVWSETEKNTYSKQIIGCYLPPNEEKAEYMGISLSRFPAKYTQLPNEAQDYGKATCTGTAVSEIWLDGRTVLGSVPENMYKQDMMLYSHNGIEALLTREDYHNCVEALRKLKRIFQEADAGTIDLDSKDGQTVCRLEWTRTTRKWIEKIKMYDPNVNYIQ